MAKKRKVTRQQVKELYESINKCLKLKGGKFSYTLMKARNLIKDEYENIKAALVIPPEYAEYTMKRREVNELFCERDDNGKPILIEGARGVFYQIPVYKQPEYKSRETSLNKEYFEAIKKFEEVEQEFTKLLAEEIEIELPVLKQDELPTDISGEQLIGIRLLVEGLEF